MAKPYSRTIQRSNRALVVFLLDQSFSMEDPLGGSTNRKMDELATAVNGWLEEMLVRASGGDEIKDYMDIAIFGYRTDLDENPIIESPLAGELAQKPILSLAEIKQHARMEKRTQAYYDPETGDEGQRETVCPVWIEAKAEGATPMCSALHKVYEIVESWLPDHQDSFPPIVIHITDGENTEDSGNPLDYAEPLKELSTDDGNVLLLNCHLSEAKAQPFMFPHSDEILPNDFARMLFEMSSPLPETLYSQAVALGFELQPGARGMVFNANMVDLIKFLDIGTKVAKQLR